jgi:hypothetical protein
VFPRWWADRFGQTPPLGYRLRQAFPERWLRIHSLPESKRYPQNAAELEIMLERHATVATEVLGRGAECLVVTATYHERVALGTTARWPDRGERSFECFATMAEQGDQLPSDVSFWVAPSRWDPDAERDVLVGIADDRVRVLWLGIESGQVYAPYDGGADLILAEPGHRRVLSLAYRDWLSKLASGL